MQLQSPPVKSAEGGQFDRGLQSALLKP